MRVHTYPFGLLIGLSILDGFIKDLAAYESQRQELLNAERLFNLSPTSCPELSAVQRELKGLTQIYTIYKAMKVGPSKAVKRVVFMVGNYG